MNTRTRVSLTAVAACVVVAALSGCAASTPTPAPSATTAMTGDKTPLPSPSPTATDAATTDDQTPSTPPTSPSKAPGTSALAQHIYDECSKGAADAGVTLTFTDDPSGYPGSDGTYQLVYPFTFDDGHTDPYAVYNCTLTDDTVDSSYVSSGMTDSH
ncbi:MULTISPECIES: hypothetical protein [Curtobacterium]|jgi:hypothetical protein|uniref:Uncharacterized protein n=1 Tax=Curtobacterium poinsettiae TaxID=159612 RepID=A0ABT3S4B0_9MICO|nr:MULTISPECIES: hypothetical protein [Curtobacterium]KIQ10491.1 hypothetical protein RU06_05590 [Curtobacterium flaccumfaciens]MBF4596907.1 hypothetical protein [Curtobacterium sp. VKM Ac-1796]MBF4612231.1 hypothetical protein [Curtobacterium sp. VKM Ac-2889]MBT1611808.1 hypothetical protein [Curtobacterium flaccumfaciens pv. poinsettiae]MBT1620880.1 hypothetical protein [Curtobacterium flaccumfaciens pv. poinsettiae]